MKLLRIANWSENFENNRTRELKKLDWVPIPNKHDGDGYTELIEHPNGMAHYGAWCMIVQVASKCDTRGTLLRDGRIEVRESRTLVQRGGRPHDAASLARKTRGNPAIFAEAIQRLLSIGWLEIIDCESTTCENPAAGCDNPAGSCGNPATGCLEGKGREGNRREPPIVPQGDERAVQAKLVLEAPEPELSKTEFAQEIFALYPRKDGKADALKAIMGAFKSIPPLELRVRVEQYAEAVATWPDHEKQFVPWCQKWMNKKRWLDDPALWVRQLKLTLEQIELQIATHPANSESKRHNPNCSEEQKNHLRALRIQRKEMLNGRQ